MIGRAKNKRRRREFSLIPLINIVFLLLLFFLVSGSWKNHEASLATLPLSQSLSPSLGEEGRVLVIEKGGRMTLDKNIVTFPQLKEQLAEDKSLVLKIYADSHADASIVMDILTSLPPSDKRRIFLMARKKNL